MGLGICCPNDYLRPQVVLDIQVWLPTRDRDGKSHPFAEELCLVSEESTGKKLWERLGNVADIRINQKWNQRRHSSRKPSQPITRTQKWNCWSCLWEIPVKIAIPFNLIPCIITFDLKIIFIIIDYYYESSINNCSILEFTLIPEMVWQNQYKYF